MADKCRQTFSYELTKPIAVLSDVMGCRKEVNLIKFNGKPAKLDIRNWQISESGERRMLKGISLTDEEAQILRQALEKWAEE